MAGSDRQLALSFVDALSDRRASPSQAGRLIEQALAEGWEPRTLLLDVLPEALHEIGRRWQDGRASVAEEHLVTALAQDTIRALSAALPRAARRDASVMVAAVDGELHSIGSRMLADLLEADGWDVLYLGASSPATALATLAEERQPKVIALSATLDTHLDALRETVEQLRSGASRDAYVIIGGQACRHVTDPIATIGADACELRADDAVRRLAEYADTA